ncbi:MAG: DUF4334 domain-containing protein, partial [Myxococcota bacterium]
VTNEDVHPLVFFNRDRSELYAVEPSRVPFNTKLPKDERLGILMGMARTILETKESRARLRNLEYRGRVSATMIYDGIPIMDSFAKIDDRRALGVMDLKGQPDPFFFVLERDDDTAYEVTPLKAAEAKFQELFDMEIQNRAFALKSSQLMASESSSDSDRRFYGSWAAFEERLQQLYAPHAKKYGLSQEARGMANLQVGISRLAIGILPDSVVFESVLDQTEKYLEKLKELERVAPAEDAAFFSFVVEQEEVQIDALKLRVEGRHSDAADLLDAFTRRHSA